MPLRFMKADVQFESQNARDANVTPLRGRGKSGASRALDVVSNLLERYERQKLAARYHA